MTLELEEAAARPLAVDLDGTLVKTDTLVELTLVVIKHNWLALFLLPLWLVRGRPYFKRQLAARGRLSAEMLSYTDELVQYLREQKDRGRSLCLVSAAAPAVAKNVAGHLGFFEDVIVSDTIHLSGKAKARALAARFGRGGYVYAGNSWRDVPVWRAGAGAIVVNASKAVERSAGAAGPIERVIAAPKVTWQTWARLLRSYQWIKNVLVFVPMVAAHVVTPEAVRSAALAWAAFCLVASSSYLLNDLFDLPADRQHSSKRRRPLAAGEVSLLAAVVLWPVLIAMGLGIGSLVSPVFVGWLGAYLVMANLYSLLLKQWLLIDVVMLGLLYTLRIFAGASAVEVVVSAWLLVFSLFLFMSLALLKRFCELARLSDGEQSLVAGRGYHVADRVPIGVMGIASGYLAALVLSLYISSEEVVVLYRRPEGLWLLVPLLLYWISRVWVLAWRGDTDDDPVVFAERDLASYVVLGVGLATVWLAI